MKDNVSQPNLGQANKDYDAQYFWTTYRAIEQWMGQVVSKGDAQIANLSVDQFELSGNATIGGSLEVDGTASLHNTTVTGTLSVSGTASLHSTTITGTFGTSGLATLDSLTVTNTSALHNTTVAGTLGVTGTASIGGTLTYLGADIDTRYVNATGDTMTGPLNVAMASAVNTSVAVWNSVGAGALEVDPGGNTNIVFDDAHAFQVSKMPLASIQSGSFASATNLLNVNAAGLLTLPFGQIAFPAIANLSTNANTMDDYEEGLFTPSFAGSTTAGTFTYTYREGVYFKIGRQVYFLITMLVSPSVAAAGNLYVTGLPFLKNAVTQFGVATIGYSGIVVTGATAWGGIIEGNPSYVRVAYATSGGALANYTPATSVGANTWFMASGFYLTDA